MVGAAAGWLLVPLMPPLLLVCWSLVREVAHATAPIYSDAVAVTVAVTIKTAINCTPNQPQQPQQHRLLAFFGPCSHPCAYVLRTRQVVQDNALQNIFGSHADTPLPKSNGVTTVRLSPVYCLCLTFSLAGHHHVNWHVSGTSLVP